MQQSDIRWFDGKMRELQTCYGSFRVPADEWTRKVDSYFARLRMRSQDDVQKAMLRAPEDYPDRFPTTGQLIKLISADTLERGERKRQNEASRMSQREDDVAREAYRNTPATPEGAREWIEEATSPFEKLARLWQCESRTLGIDPTSQTPPELHIKRMREFWQTWERYTGDRVNAD